MKEASGFCQSHFDVVVKNMDHDLRQEGATSLSINFKTAH